MKSLKNICIVVLTTFVFGTALSCKKDAPAEETAPVHILIYTKTKAFRHECIEPGSKALQAYFSVHAASDTEYDWPWYGQLVGAYFANHPDIQQHFIEKVDTAHISCKHLPMRWKRMDECYNFKSLPVNVNVLLTADESTYQGGTHGDYHPMSWYHEYDGPQGSEE